MVEFDPFAEVILEQLLQEYAHVFAFHKDEEFLPVAVECFLEKAIFIPEDQQNEINASNSYGLTKELISNANEKSLLAYIL
ncbi:MAG: hypothetical protein OEZ01_02905 [Candidatus Heimdallarchaeota archaeon]|nr:hypothetical protein [Candidatus Heimdallarchaeota archaeon]MDH5644927.1 hypothetical protein [Candidatus Heimdallarchaeota archaeon]